MYLVPVYTASLVVLFYIYFHNVLFQSQNSHDDF